MRIVQQPSRFQRTEFEFGDKELKYVFDGEGTKIAFTIPYTGISTDKSMQSQRAYVLSAIGCTIFLSAILTYILTLSDLDGILAERINKSSLHFFELFVLGYGFFGLAIGFYGARPGALTKTVLHTDPGLVNILVFHDGNQIKILDEIENRRKSELRRINGTVDMLNHPELELKKFLWLKEKGIISNEEFVAAHSEILSKLRTVTITH
jgi:hypothetical protein